MKYLKKGLFCLIFCFFSCLATSALAKGGFPTAPYFDGFYAGLGGGIVSAMADTKNSFDAYPDPGYGIEGELLAIKYDADDLGKHGVNGNIFIGFGKTLNTHYYFGGEIFGHLFSPKMQGGFSFAESNLKAELGTEVKNPYSFGGDIRGGYLIFPRVMLYALFGLDYAKFKVNSNVNIYPDSQKFSFENNFNKWRLGYTPGLGIELGFADHLSVRAQYEYTFYPSFSHLTKERVMATIEGFPVPVDVFLNNKIKASRGLFTLKLSYLF